jgi:hypothetical protein
MFDTLEIETLCLNKPQTSGIFWVRVLGAARNHTARLLATRLEVRRS